MHATGSGSDIRTALAALVGAYRTAFVLSKDLGYVDRAHLINVPGRLARHGRGQITLHLPAGWHAEHPWLALFEATHRLPPGPPAPPDRRRCPTPLRASGGYGRHRLRPVRRVIGGMGLGDVGAVTLGPAHQDRETIVQFNGHFRTRVLDPGRNGRIDRPHE